MDNPTRSWLWLISWATYCKIQAQIEKSTENHWPFRYDLNQIPYDDKVDMTNGFNGLDQVDSAWRTMDRGSQHCSGGHDQNSKRKINARRQKWLSEEALQIAEKRRDGKEK